MTSPGRHVVLGTRGDLLPIDVALVVMQAIAAAAQGAGYTDLRTNNAGQILGLPPGVQAAGYPPRAPHAHVCVTCSPDGAQRGPGCGNCRHTGMDQTPCTVPGHHPQCPAGCCTTGQSPAAGPVGCDYHELPHADGCPGPPVCQLGRPEWPKHGVGSLAHGESPGCGDDCNNGMCQQGLRQQGLRHGWCTPECTALVIWDLRTGGAWTPGAANLAGAGPDDLVVLADLIAAGGPPAELPQPVHHYNDEGS